MAIISTDTRYGSADRPRFGRLFRDPAWIGDRPCVLVFPEGFGISEHTWRQAERIAALGYAALACDVFGDGYFYNGPSPETRRRVDEIISRPHGLCEEGKVPLDFVAGAPGIDTKRVAAAGYCLGGTIAMAMAFGELPIRAAFAFHPGFSGLDFNEMGRFACPLRIYAGAEDYSTPPVARAELEKAMQGKRNDWRMTIYGSVLHGFTNDNCQGMGDRVGYDAGADQASFADMADLLARVFA